MLTATVVKEESMEIEKKVLTKQIADTWERMK